MLKAFAEFLIRNSPTALTFDKMASFDGAEFMII